jgi:predicted dehydrogenase
MLDHVDALSYHSAMTNLRVGLIGYGTGGRWFHAPYLEAAEGIDLVGVVTRSPKRAALVRADLPGVAVYPTLDDLIDAGVEAVAISTPPQTRRALVLEAVAQGLHVIADKPFAPSAEAAGELERAARSAGVLLNVFHNRREDTDIVTAKRVLDSGELGQITRLDLRFDLDEPDTLEGGPTGGLLRDLGTHVVDQALQLLGPAAAVHADLFEVETEQGPTDSAFAIALEHTSGARSYVSASKLSRLVSRELRLHGTAGSYVSDFSDVQTAAIFAGSRPAAARASWGIEREARWGILRTAEGERRVPSAQGDYTRYYEAFAAAVASGGEGPVPAGDGVEVLRVLDAVRESAQQRRTVEVAPAT